ncbi:tetratricopeptide repeat protein [Dyadobacter sp. CY323]|uniref:tetratricopeptide repeat protein n=1 Tax=Dyadobacter sp. CY323 TaxID=2907302 RepID=UPI001F2F1C47|nr:tetratricopeptide repeat protein [Dyadobacter sp. CY323]MCE6991455.1 tetratricopeptide repeat protein [Dyadobacter sp. CY323]
MKANHIRMRFYAGISLLIVSTLIASETGFAQDTLSIRDQQEIQLLAQRKVEKGLGDLLNTIAFEDLGDFERKALRADSYGSSPNKIFFNEKVIVENDVNPEHTSKQTGADVTVERYLADFELFYPKSIDRTVSFSEFKVSKLKKSDYYYVKVYFQSRFGGTHSQIKTPYKETARVAEVRAEKKGKKWLTFITSLGFATQADSVQNTFNDVVLSAVPVLTDSSRESQEINPADLARQKERETEKRALEEYNNWLTNGDNAFAAKDYDKALEAYTEAEKRNDFDDLLPRRKIYQVKRAFEREKQTQVELLREYLAKANIAQKTRSYTEAIGYFKKAYELKPDSTTLGETIKTLNQKSSLKTELDEKYNLGKYAEVIKDYSRILKKEKNNSDHYLGRGLAYAVTNDHDRALKDFTQAIELDFANLAALRARSELYTSKKDYPKAAADLTSYLNIDHAAVDILTRRARLRTLTNNKTGALEDYSKAIELNPASAQTYFNRALYHIQQENYSAAVIDLTSAIDKNQSYNEAYYQRGLCQIKLSRPEIAGKDFARVRQLGITEEQNKEITSIALQYFHIAFGRFSEKNYGPAITGFDEVIHILPNHSQSWYHKGRSLEKVSDTLAAMESYDMAILHLPDYGEAYLDRAYLWFYMGRYEKAEKDFHKVVQIQPSNYLAVKGEGDAGFALKAYDRAIVSYENIKANEKKIGQSLTSQQLASVYNNLGSSYFFTEQPEKSIEEFDRAISLNATFSDAYYNRGKAYESTKNLRRAISDYKKSTALDATNSLKYFALGNALYSDEAYEEAGRAFSAAIENDQDNKYELARSTARRADCFIAMAQYKNAAADYLSAFALDSATQTPEGNYNLGVAFLHQKEANQSLKFLLAVGNKDRLKGLSYYAIGCAYILQRKNEEALKWFEKSFQTGLITKSYIRRDKLLDSVDKSFASTAAFKDLVNQNVIK